MDAHQSNKQRKPSRPRQERSASPDQDESVWLRHWGSGSASAGAQLAQIYIPELRRFFAARAPEPDVGDLVQMTMLRLCQRAMAWRGEGSVRSYVLGFAWNILREYIRGKVKRVRGQDSLEQIEAFAAQVQSSVTSRYARLERASLLLRGLRGLDDESLLLLKLRIWLELDWCSVAAVTGLTEKTAQYRCRRALEQMRGMLSSGTGQGEVERWAESELREFFGRLPNDGGKPTESGG